MSTQPEALRKADLLAEYLGADHPAVRAISAELRRLHAENELLHERHHFDNGVLKELLKALKNIDTEFTKHGRQHWPEAVKARAAIKKAEGA